MNQQLVNLIKDKQNNSSSPSKITQKLKIQLNDKIFQLRKMEQDYATDKAKLVIQFQKQKTIFNRTIKELRQKSITDNEEWALKVEELRHEYSERLKVNIEKLKEKQTASIENAEKLVEKKYVSQINDLKQKINDLSSKKLHAEEAWKQQKNQIITHMVENHRKKEQELTKEYNNNLAKIKTQNDSRLSILEQVLQNEQLNRKKMQEEKDNIFQEHIKDKIHQQSKFLQLQSEIEFLKQSRQQYEYQIQALKSQIKQQRQKHFKQLQQKNKIHETDIKIITDQYQRKIHQQHKNNQAFVAKITNELHKIESINKEKQKLWDDRGKKVLELLEKRQSKKQDIKAIEQLEVQLIKKDFLLERQRGELKNCKLQMENMEDIYDRIFITNGYANKLKNRSFKVKKLRNSQILNDTNHSIVLSESIKEHCKRQKVRPL